ncbi:MAG: redox-regulated ATPase YchF [bacterium]
MGFSCGIIGLPNVGKSTIFNALTAAGAPSSNYPFCTIEPNVGVVAVPDPRLQFLASMLHPPRVTPTVLEFRDIAGLVEGAHQGRGRGNQFLDHIRNVDVLAHVVRCFQDPDVVHVDGEVNPLRDMEVLETELILADLQLLERRMEKLRRAAKSQEKEVLKELAFLEQLAQGLDRGMRASSLDMPPEQKARLATLGILTGKPLFYVANVGEDELQQAGPRRKAVEERARKESTLAVPICGKVEEELLELSAEDRAEFLRAYGLESSGLQRVIKAGYDLLGLVTFYTVVGRELRAWTVSAHTEAPKAAGKIHSDMEKGFIRAEVISFEALKQAGSLARAKEEGLVRLEGRDYQIQDGDIVTFRFNP